MKRAQTTLESMITVLFTLALLGIMTAALSHWQEKNTEGNEKTMLLEKSKYCASLADAVYSNTSATIALQSAQCFPTAPHFIAAKQNENQKEAFTLAAMVRLVPQAGENTLEITPPAHYE